MSDITSAADSMAAEAEVTPPTQAEAQAAETSGEAEGTTPEEVAQVLRGAGMKVDTDTTLPEAADAEEGDDPDAPTAEETSEEDAAGEGTDAEEVANEEPIESAKPTEAAPAEEVADSADDKYSFTVTDAEGQTFKITAGDDLDEVLAEFQPKSTGQLINIMRQLDRAENQQESDKAQAAQDAEKAEQTQRVADIRKGWDSEVTDLTAQKRIPAGTEGETRVQEVYKFMADQNDARIKAGRPTIGSFEDALDKLEAQENREAKIAADKADKDEARRKGGLVGGSSTPASSGTPVYRAGSARNVNQAIKAANLL